MTDEVKTQQSFDKMCSELSEQPAPQKKSTRTKGKDWIKKSWDYHSEHIDECYVAPDWGDWETDWNMCWACGHKGTLQACHIIPNSLGGTTDPSNIIPLCGLCHDKSPDVLDKKEMINWIKDQQNPVSGLGLGRYWHLAEILPPLIENLRSKYGDIDEDELYDLIGENYEKTSPHGGQNKQGLFWKESTREWIIKRAFKDYEINREIEDWEE